MTRVRKQLNPALHGAEADRLKDSLRRKIVGQDDAIRQIVSVYQTFLAGLAPQGRPVGNFLLLGPTGSGKTYMVEALAEALTGNSHAFVKVDCAEFQHSHEIAKLIGSPPGYLGHRETRAALSQEAIDQHQTAKLKLSLVLFDEIEKASDALWNLLLGILDKGALTLGDNRQVDFSRTVIFMTSNLGAREMMNMVAPRIGFAGAPPSTADLTQSFEQAAIQAARRKFSPEFLNRIDKVLVFHPLGRAEIRGILNLELENIEKRLMEGSTTPFDFVLSERARAFLLEEGIDVQYGARHLKRALERSLVNPLANLLASGQIATGDTVRVDLERKDRRLVFYKEREEERTTARAA